tara:strand:+ start:1034 stop:1405 length:372 start_codon:yes stop_codon:yes gene_type:complete
MKKSIKFKYNIDNIKLFGYHGVYKIEKEKGQFFFINIKYSLYLINQDISDDNLNNIVDYSEVVLCIKNIFNNKRYNLIENLILDMKYGILKNFDLKDVHISIIKDTSNLSLDFKSINVSIDNE